MFIVFEGIDLSGKSTQAKILAEKLGPAAILTREPGGTPIGEQVRGIVLHHDGPIDPMTEAYLMAAGRAAHVRRVIRPALEADQILVSDRHVGSSIAYQGAGRRLGESVVAEINRHAVDGLAPDLTLVIDIPNEVFRERRAAKQGLDRIERQGQDFFERVAESFRRQSSLPNHALIDGVGSIEEVAERVLGAVAPLLGSASARP